MSTDSPRRAVEPGASRDPEIGRWLWALEDTRRRTMTSLQGLRPDILDWSPPGGNSISTLLYHIAAIEADWLYADVLEQEFPPEITALFPYDVRDSQDWLTRIQGHSLAAHMQRLNTVREALLAVYRGMTAQDYHTPRRREGINVTPEWVLHHLMQHEAEHRGHIQAARTLGEGELGTG